MVTAKPAKTKKTEKNMAPSGAPLAQGTGRRKAAVARVWMRRGNGVVRVNGKDFSEYFTVDVSRLNVRKPFEAVPQSANYHFDVNVVGGGYHSQADAVKLGIARALVASDESFRLSLRDHGLLTVDDRVKERKKFGQRGARRKFQFVKR
jgi:small subunit ribosomal protein S9